MICMCKPKPEKVKYRNLGVYFFFKTNAYFWLPGGWTKCSDYLRNLWLHVLKKGYFLKKYKSEYSNLQCVLCSFMWFTLI